ncbi:MAG: Mur ligase family protein [Firmicutes bacterium]|nr:Mur ligase family protein [Bacillota bacterium]
MFQLTLSLIFSAISAVLLTLSSLKILQILQLSAYRPKGIFVWLKRSRYDYLKRFLCLAFFSFITAFLLIMSFPEFYFRYAGFAFFIVFSCFFIMLQFKEKQKTRLVFTNRILRIISVLAILYFLISFSLIYFLFDVSRIEFTIVSITPLLIPFVTILAFLIMFPIDMLIGKIHFNRARNKLKMAEDLIKIGISGSYGKTTTKNILAVLLSEKYKVLSSPKSFNTPMGLAKIINENNLHDFDVFLAEMGAKRVGETQQLCEFIKPKFGVVTKLGSQHLETFLTLDNAADTEFSLAKYIKELVVLNINDELVRQRIDSIDKTKAVFLGEHANYSNIEISEDGLKFDLNICGESVKISTKLLGRHVAEIFSQAALLAYKMGVGLEDIKRLAEKIEPVKHRLELIKTSNGVVLDDAYNSNPEGALNALEVLSCFDGIKVVVTPGFIELGDIENKENFKLGQHAAKIADYLIVIKNFQISKGAIDAGLEENKVINVDSLDKAMEELKKLALDKQAVLFINDLPDNY